MDEEKEARANEGAPTSDEPKHVKDESTPPEHAQTNQKSGFRRWIQTHRKLTIAAVVILVIVIAGGAFWVWHETPGFCNAICHSPMDPYVESFHSDDESLGITVHAQNDVRCLNCHEAVLTDQVSEAMAWASDNYSTTSDGMLADGLEFASESFCTKSGCHHDLGDSYDEISQNLWGFEGNGDEFNPHLSHQSQALDCGDCHNMHSSQVLVCNDCHNLYMPNGWITPKEAQNEAA